MARYAVINRELDKLGAKEHQEWNFVVSKEDVKAILVAVIHAGTIELFAVRGFWSDLLERLRGQMKGCFQSLTGFAYSDLILILERHLYGELLLRGAWVSPYMFGEFLLRGAWVSPYMFGRVFVERCLG